MTTPIEPFLDQILQASAANLHFVALQAALTVPDICASLAAADGRSTGDRYKAWFREHLEPSYTQKVGADIDQIPGGMETFILAVGREKSEALQRLATTGMVFLSAEQCWGFRCAMLHQGRAHDTDRPDPFRIAFFEPSPRLHDHMNKWDDLLTINVASFCGEMVDAGRAWVARMAGAEPVRSNLLKVIQRRSGIRGVIEGTAIIG